MTTSNSSGPNPSKDGQIARQQHNIALDILKKNFNSVEKVVTITRVRGGKQKKSSTKQIYLINGNSEKPFYVMIMSAPSNVKLREAITGELKKYKNYPMYILFTREMNTYKINYMAKVKSCYNEFKNSKHLMGMILGTDKLNDSTFSIMKSNSKIKLDLEADIIPYVTELYNSGKSLSKEALKLVMGKKSDNILITLLKALGINFT